MNHLVTLAHAHPDLSRGGAEIAAHTLHSLVNDAPGWRSTFGAACNEAALRHVGTSLGIAPNGTDTLFHVRSDPYTFAALRPEVMAADLGSWLRALNPSVVHLHHYLHFGVELIRVVRNALPACPIVVTLHEFLAICARDGQMVKSDGRLCHRETPAECALCMPQYSPQDFFMRKLYIQSFMKLVDCFIAPSRFLRDRYIEWGLPSARVTVLENPLRSSGARARASKAARDAPGSSQARRVRFGYFGQITPYKGVEILVDAFNRLPQEIRQYAELEIHGGGHERFGDDFRQKIVELSGRADHRIQFCGPYEPSNVSELMRAVDWVVVPSRWWENSPLTIQEAFSAGRPVICGDIGGMAEKVTDGLDGVHYRAGSSTSLMHAFERVIANPALGVDMAQRLVSKYQGQAEAGPFVRLYHSLLSSADAPSVEKDAVSVSKAPLSNFAFICSTGRAGSTLLAKCLNAHKSIVMRDQYPYETRIIQYLLAAKFNERPALENELESFRGVRYAIPMAADRIAKAWAEKSRDNADLLDYYGLARAYYEAVADEQGKRAVEWIVEKAVGLQMTDEILAADHGARAIVLLRDPRDVFCSIRAFNKKASYSKGFGADSGDDALFRSLVTFIKLSEKLQRCHTDRVHIVRYEDLIRSEAALARLLSWLGVPFGDELVSAIWTQSQEVDADTADHSTSASATASVGRWCEDAEDEDRNLFKKYANELARWGYDQFNSSGDVVVKQALEFP